MIVFYSGTGNSRYCARFLEERLGDGIIDAFHFIQDGVAAELCSLRPWVFVSPTYGWRQPRIFEDFLRAGSFGGSREAYFVMTCGDEIGNAGVKLEALCREKGFVYRGVLQVRMPENYVAMFPVPDRAESADIIAAARPVLESGAEDILRGSPFPPPSVGLVDKLKTALVNPIFYAVCVKARRFYATDACVGCGKCQRECPLRNIRLVDGRPVWGENCTHCMRCICLCPGEAIEYGKISLGKPRYQCPDYAQRD
jgi:flavodoxin/NAD-dependent dihydropyrimidine dehydrogenase PreA subunit